MLAKETAVRNVLIVGGSYVGLAIAKELSAVLPSAFKIILVEPNSHFNHLFAFPRFSVVPGYEHKAFIPYTSVFSNSIEPGNHSVIQARVLSLTNKAIELDRPWQGKQRIEFEYAIVATGTRLPPPGTIPLHNKIQAAGFLKGYQKRINSANTIVIVGGGAIGVQLATDIKDTYPSKDVTLVHSREQLMPHFHPKMNEIVRQRLAELNINLITGSRAVLPASSETTEMSLTEFALQDGRKITGDLVIPATGQIPNNQFLDPSLLSSKGFVKVKQTLQFQDVSYQNVFAAGDIADSGVQKAAHPGYAQATVVVKNLMSMIGGKGATEQIEIGPAGIHLSLGLRKNLMFTDPDPNKGEVEPIADLRNDGERDMGIDGWWEWENVKVSGPDDYFR